MNWIRRRRSELLRGLLIVVVLGVLIGVFEVWEFEMSWNRLFAAIASGVGFMIGLVASFLFLGGAFPAGNRTVEIAVFALAGATGGVCWWLVVRPQSHTVFTCVMVGVAMAVLSAVADGLWTKSDSQAA